MIRIQFQEGASVVEYPEATEVLTDGDWRRIVKKTPDSCEVIAEFLAHEGMVLG